MAFKSLALALATILAATPAAATQQDQPRSAAPPGTPTTLYCLRVTLTGSAVEPVKCWTREEWAEQDVDVDREWAANGVRTIDA